MGIRNPFRASGFLPLGFVNANGTSTGYVSGKQTLSVINSFSVTGNTEVFANNADLGESARNELSHLKSALFAFQLLPK